MNQKPGPSRRAMLGAGVTALSTAAAPALAKSARPRVLFLLGDYYHNGAMQEYAWRKVLKSTGWQLLFAQAPSFVTPKQMASADLYVLCRYSTDTQPTNISLGWSADKIVENRPEPDVFMTPEHESMIASNVKRGMGLLAVHCAIWNPKSRQFLDVLGVEKPIMHGPVVNTTIFDLNQEHPITKGIGEFRIGIDEAFNAVMKSGASVPLFRSKQQTPARDAVSGWCREEGSGRVVALLPGHTTGPYGSKPFLELMWRSAHWALKRDIPPMPAEIATARG